MNPFRGLGKDVVTSLITKLRRTDALIDGRTKIKGHMRSLASRGSKNWVFILIRDKRICERRRYSVFFSKKNCNNINFLQKRERERERDRQTEKRERERGR